MRICFFTKHEIDWGSSRQRIGVYLSYLSANGRSASGGKERGHSYEIIHCIPNRLSRLWIGGNKRGPLTALYSLWYGRILKYVKFLRLIAIARPFDKIVIQKVYIPSFLIRILRGRNKEIIFDFDDQCFRDTESGPGDACCVCVSLGKKINFIKRGLGDPRVLRLYKYVIAGNTYLKEKALAVRRDGVIVIPTPIDCVLYQPRENKEDVFPVTIGWAGSGENHLRHLKLLVEPFKELIKKYDINFKLIGAMGSDRIKGLFEFLGSRFIPIDWVSGDELPRLIRTFDIGIMPLNDDDEARSKCGFKILQYMASGIAVAASPVGVNREIVEDGTNGFLAKDNEEWIKKLSYLIEDASLRRKFGIQGRKTVEDRYSLETTAKAFLEVIERQNK